MKSPRMVCTALSLLAAPTLAARAPAQTSTVPPAAGSTGDMTGVALGAAVLLVLVIVIGASVKLFDLRRRRADEAAALQARISDALMTDPMLSRFPIATTAHRGLMGSSPVIVDVHGTLPSTSHRESAISVVRAEAGRTGMPFSIEDQIAVDPLMAEEHEEVGAR
jgi:hypothetical protein